MARMPETNITQDIVTHTCGMRLRVVLRMFGCNLHAVKGNMAEMTLTCERYSIAYYTHDAEEKQVHYCPGCGEALKLTLKDDANE